MNKRFLFVGLGLFAFMIGVGSIAAFFSFAQNSIPEATELIAGRNSRIPTNPGAKCGQLDSDNNGIINVLDFSSFATIFGQECSKAISYSSTGCGAQDANLNGRIDDEDTKILMK